MSTTKEPAYLVEYARGVGVYGHPFLHNDDTLLASALTAEAAMEYAESVSPAAHVYGITYQSPWDEDDPLHTRRATLDLNMEDEEAIVAICYKRHGGAIGEQLQAILNGDNLFSQNPNALAYLPSLLRERDEHQIAEALSLFLSLEQEQDDREKAHAGAWKATLRKAEGGRGMYLAAELLSLAESCDVADLAIVKECVARLRTT